MILGGRILAAALKFEERISVGATRRQAFETLGSPRDEEEKAIFEALREAKVTTTDDAVKVLPVRSLGVGMVLQEDVWHVNGNLVVSHGHEITEGSRQRLRNYSELGIPEENELAIHLPASDEEEDSGTVESGATAEAEAGDLDQDTEAA